MSTASSVSPTSPRDRLTGLGRWSTLLAGVSGGALGGLADALATLARGSGGLVGGRAAWLLAVAVGTCALAGAILAALTIAVAALVRVTVKRRVVAVTAVIAGAPLVIVDAFALFGGARAARVPGHTAISLALVAAGLLATAVMATGYARALEAARQPGSRRMAFLTAALLLVAAAGLHAANRLVLPRLYRWFHVSLSLLFLVAMVAAAGLLLAAAGRSGGARARARPFLPLGALGAAAGLFALSLVGLRHSQIVRYAAHERTVVTSVLLQRLPLPRARSFIARAEQRMPELYDEPLPEGPHRANADVVLVTIDALRFDHVGAYGYGRGTTPHIDALARKAVRFQRAYAQAPHTSFSVASMLTGKYYPTIARLGPGDTHDPVTEVLRRYGWKTAAFYPPAVFFVDAHKLEAYRDSNFSFEYVKVGDFSDAFQRVEQVKEFFALENPRKVFLWVHLFEPHEPYEEHPGFALGKSDLDRYDSEIAYADAALGKLIAYLGKKRPGAILIVTADHGEEFDEHGGRYHGSTLYEEQVRVPLLVVVPGLAPHVVSGPAELIDIAPTILGLLDIPIPPRMRGTDLGPWLGVPPVSEIRLPPAFAEVGDTRMMVWGTDKLICELNWGYCRYFDLGADPREQKNLAEERPERAAVLKRRLDDWLDDHVRFEPQLVRGPSNPAGEEVPRAIERGRLGDVGAAAELADMLRSSESAPLRREAARLLVALPPRVETRAQVVAALAADDEEVRSWAAVAAARLGEAGALDRLRALVASTPPAAGSAAGDGGRELRVRAAMALARAHDASGVPVLAEALDHCQRDVLLCQIIIIDLGALRDRRAVPALLAHLRDVQNRREMVQALGEIGDPAVVPGLVERLRADEYVPVRAEAATALGKIGGPAAIAGLEWSVRHEEEPAVVAPARAALASARAKAPPPPAPAPAPARPPGPRRRVTYDRRAVDDTSHSR